MPDWVHLGLMVELLSRNTQKTRPVRWESHFPKFRTVFGGRETSNGVWYCVLQVLVSLIWPVLGLQFTFEHFFLSWHILSFAERTTLK